MKFPINNYQFATRTANAGNMALSIRHIEGERRTPVTLLGASAALFGGSGVINCFGVKYK